MNPTFPSDLYTRFEFSPVMKPKKKLRHVSLGNDAYPAAVAGMDWLVGGYLENRKGMYSSELYQAVRYIHLGIDIWAKPGEPVFAVADGVIYGVKDNDLDLDYGPTVIVEHEVLGIRFFVLYGHLSRESINRLETGQKVVSGELLARLGDEKENGGWVPHLHVQLGINAPVGVDMPGACAPEDTELCRVLYPDPRFILGPLY